MLLALALIYQILVAFASPYNQYPFVFLLNAGNEDLDNTSTEQIRVSLPGGSVALRYPAFGYGDTIANVKVIGIDLVKDLKVNIVDGGPGYNYVVLAISGKSKAPYDVLVTLQMIPFTNNVFLNADAIRNDGIISDPYGFVQDRNDSAEDTSDVEPTSDTRKTRMNAELTQQSSWNTNNYDLNDKVVSTKENDSDNSRNQKSDNDNEDNNDDDENYVEDDSSENDNNEFENEVNKNASDDTDDIAYAPDIHRPTPEQFSDKEDVTVQHSVHNQSSNNINQVLVDDKYSDDDYNDDAKVKVNSNLFKMYESLRPHLYYNNAVEEKDYNNYKQQNENEGYEDDPTEIDQMFNDEEVHGKYSDINNNNNFDTDDSSAVEY